MTEVLAYLAAHLPKGLIDLINASVAHNEITSTWVDSLILVIAASFVLGFAITGRYRVLNLSLAGTTLVLILALNLLLCYGLGQHSDDPTKDILYGISELWLTFACTAFVGIVCCAASVLAGFGAARSTEHLTSKTRTH